jgi:anti-sigma28 factor (negative regulator of flagellin synthesis)
MLLLGLGKTALSKEAAISRGIAVAAYHVAHLISETKTESLLKAQQEALEKAKYEAEKQKQETEKITRLGDDERRKVFLGLKDLKNQQGSLDTVSVEKLRFAMENGQLSLDEAAAAKALLKQKDNVYSASPVYASHLRKMIS